jgi:hypothetical protein
MDMQTNSQPSNKMSAIDRALAAAKARKSQRIASGEEAAETPVAAKPAKEPKAPKTPKVKEPKANDEAREASRQQRDAERVERLAAKAAKLAAEAEAKAAAKAAREAAKAEKRAVKEAEKAVKKPAHMKKVERARAKCPALNEAAALLFGDITSNLSAQQIDALAQHLVVHNRAMQTIRACQSAQLPMGATVRITGGDPKFVGMVGEVVHTQKLRAKVAVPGITKPVYIYTGEAELFAAEAGVAEAV